ncbi:YaiI/YqxD family protein [Carnobacteriaceae bacterium 52-44]
MKIIVDADASPVKNEIIQLAGQYTVPVVLVSSIAHYSFETYPSYVKILYVEKGADRADFKIVQLAEKGDIIVTQDYGLASLLLPKGCRVVHHMGYEYTNENIERLLQNRHIGALKRKSGERTKGPRPFTEANRQNFIVFFNELLEETSKNK